MSLIVTGQIVLVELNGDEKDFDVLKKVAKENSGFYLPKRQGLNGSAFGFRRRDHAEAFCKAVLMSKMEPS